MKERLEAVARSKFYAFKPTPLRWVGLLNNPHRKKKTHAARCMGFKTNRWTIATFQPGRPAIINFANAEFHSCSSFRVLPWQMLTLILPSILPSVKFRVNPWLVFILFLPFFTPTNHLN